MTYSNEKYQELMENLYAQKDENYRKFHQKLLKDDKIKVIGIRTPLLKKIAKKISKEDYLGFIKYNSHQTYEETVLHGLILGFIKVPENELLALISEFIPYVDNWATNDLTTANLKAFEHISIDKVLQYTKSTNPWEIRFGLTLLLDYYIKEENLKTIYTVCDTINSTHYYVNMAIAWLLSICYIKYPQMTFKYLKNCHLDKFTLNKTISKICDSYRVSKEDKNTVKALRK